MERKINRKQQKIIAFDSQSINISLIYQVNLIVR